MQRRFIWHQSGINNENKIKITLLYFTRKFRFFANFLFKLHDTDIEIYTVRIV